MPSREFIQPTYIHDQRLQVVPVLMPAARRSPVEGLLSRSDSVTENINLVLNENKRPGETAGTSEWINYLDRNWRKEGLMRNWHDLKASTQEQIGWVMKNQMALLKDHTNPSDVENWAIKTKRDLEGFKLEFLTDGNVYPRKYFRDKKDPTRLVDPMYGVNDQGNAPDIVELTSDEERKGTVKSSLQEIKEHMLSGGKLAVMVSPRGETGFKDQDGRGIDYIDSYFFVFVNQGDTVMNYTIKTDFSLEQCRKALLRLTGQNLAPDASLEEYVGAVAKFKGEKREKFQNAFDVIKVLEEIQQAHAFKDKKGNQKTRLWKDVYDDVVKGEELYNFEAQTQRILRDFYEYALEGTHSREDLQKDIAVAIHRMLQQFFETKSKEKQKKETVLVKGDWHVIEDQQLLSFGSHLEEGAKIRGCSGGGQGLSLSTILNPGRAAVPGGGGSEADAKGSLTFSCPHCGFPNKRPRGGSVETCQNTGCKKDVRC